MNEKKVIEYFNIVLLSQKDDKFFSIYECLVPTHLKCDTEKEKEYFNNLYEQISDFSTRRNYFKKFDNGSFELTPKGEKAKRKGGHYELEKYEIDKEDKQDEILGLETRLKKFELKFGNKILVIGIIFTALNFAITIVTLEFWKHGENRNELEMQIVKPTKKDKIKDSLN